MFLINRTAISYIVIVLFLLVGYAGSIFQEVGDNLVGINHILTYSRGIAPSSFDCKPEFLGYYPSLAACIQNAIQKGLESGHSLINSWGVQLFPERRSMLYTFDGRLYWKEMNYRASCEMLMKAGNKVEMQILAKKAFDQGNWDALEDYLECVGVPTGEYWSASPSQISVMFHNLGKHFEQLGSSQKALWAYKHAIDWYPTVWADPILAAARIMTGTGQRNQAVSLVLQNFNRAELPWSIFHLGRQLGKYLEEDEDILEAYCAYLVAQRAGEKSPLNHVPDNLRREVKARLLFLESSYQLSSQNCPIDD